MIKIEKPVFRLFWFKVTALRTSNGLPPGWSKLQDKYLEVALSFEE
jgi:hypothetical protein